VSPKRYVGLLRAALVLAGLATLCYAVYFGATLPEPPPNGDGVPSGFAVIYALVVQSGGALLVLLGYSLPAGTGRFRVGPLADRPAVVRATAATAAFVAAWALLTAFGWLLPDSLPRVVSGVYAFSWFGAVAGAVVGVAFTALLAVGTGIWRLAHGEPVFGSAADA
jgi:hypothetical protein